MTAKRDIECYKAMRPFRNGCQSAMQDYFYEFNKLNKHIELEFCLYNVTIRNKSIILKGYHSDRYIKNARNGWGNIPVYRCIIPKGSKYYVNDTEYVSSNIIVKEIIPC